MSFVRPEAAAFLKKWREAMIGAVVLMFNLNMAAGSSGVLNAFAWVGVLLGAALFIEGVRRARLPDKSGGLGVVEVDERQVTYLGPHGGGALSIDELARVKVRTAEKGKAGSDFFWEFTDRSGQRLTIPGDAENASALFDALTVLPGADYEAVIKASGLKEQREFLVWECAQAPRIDT
ncbi:MAG: hypothetical protein LJE62_16190 [Silicimonas sp.]|nr:hypothetical protein [Silicimonas sp.]